MTDDLPGSDRLATSFNAIAGAYAAARPDYPPALYDAVEELAGRPLAGAEVLDVGAGTGKGTRLTAERGARVVAAEPGAGMAAQFAAHLPGVPLVRADGNALPFAAAAFDLVTYAQAWHWTDPARSVPEAVRVLRPGGALALWWNTTDRSVPWARAQDERLAALPGHHRYDVTRRAPRLLAPLRTAYREVRWSRTVPLQTHLANLATHSYLAVAGPEVTGPVLAAEEAALREEFPDGRVTEPYVVRLTVAHRP
jgi:SAM-dependent methyltransferase